MKKEFKKLGDKQFVQDIKKYIKFNHQFHESKNPEINTLAKKFYEEYTLNEFYKIFNKLWNSGYENEKVLAIHSLRLYKEDFNIQTWKFLKPKIKELTYWDQIEKIGQDIIGEIIIKENSLQKEIIKLSKSKNNWQIGLSLNSTLPLIKKSNSQLFFKIIKEQINNPEREIQKIIGKILKELSLKKPEQAKRFILKNINMPNETFKTATEYLKELRKARKIKKLDSVKRGFWFFKE